MSAEVVDPDFLPFSEDELVAAEVLMGSTEADARRSWRMVANSIRATRKQFEAGRAGQGAAPGYARLSGPDVMLGLSLLSPELEVRVRQHKFGWWEQVLHKLPPEHRRQLQDEREWWEQEREDLRRRLEEEGRS